MTEYIIPPMTDVGPVTKIEHVENGYKATIGYTAQAIDKMVLRINEKLDEELIARLADQHGYKRVVLCRDCKHYEDGWCHEPDGDGGTKGWYMGKPGDGFCSEAERRES